MLGKLFESPPIFHYKLLPKFPTAHGAVWNSGPDHTSLPDCARGAYLTTYCSELLGWKFFPDFFITGCNVFFISTTLEHFFTVGLMLFPLWWEKFVCLWPFCPIFHGVFCYEFPLWVQFWVVHLSKRTGVYFTTNCLGTLLWTFFPSFPSQAVECFLQVLVLSTFLQWALSFFPYVGKICMFVAISDPIFIVFFAIDFLPGLSFGFVTNP